jgi:hypothetical protein
VTGSSYEIGLLELQRFLIKEQPAARAGGESYAIFDPRTQQQVGIARGEAGLLVRLLGWLVRSTLLPARLRVYETEDESLVFTVRRLASLWGQRSEIYDADDHFIGYGENRVFSGLSGFQLYDRRGLPFANAEGEIRSRTFRLVSRDGRELGVVACPPPLSTLSPEEERVERGDGLDSERGGESGACLVSLHEELAEQPLSKMLLLGAVLTIAMVYRGKDK